MNESEMDSLQPTEPTNQIAALQRQVFALLLALIVVSGTLTVYLWYQSRITGKEIDANKPQAMQVVEMFNQTRPIVGKLIPQLVAYGQAHPDFQPILIKYGIPLTNFPAANPAVKK
jgi:hypothetical protein